MKKVLALMAVLLLIVPAALAEPVSDINPEGYDQLLVLDIFKNADAEPDENGDFPEDVPTQVVVQGCFGSIDLSQGDHEPEFMGFDQSENGIHSFGLAENCEVLMPIDIMNPVDNAPCEDLAEWFMNVRDTWEDFDFYAKFELNEDGDLTKLEYVYYPFN